MKLNNKKAKGVISIILCIALLLGIFNFDSILNIFNNEIKGVNETVAVSVSNTPKLDVLVIQKDTSRDLSSFDSDINLMEIQ